MHSEVCELKIWETGGHFGRLLADISSRLNMGGRRDWNIYDYDYATIEALPAKLSRWSLSQVLSSHLA